MPEPRVGVLCDLPSADAPCIAIASYVKRPELRSDDRPLPTALEAVGIRSQAVVWDDETVDWDSFDGCILRSVSDYHRKYDRFLAWVKKIDGLMPIWNPVDLVTWNADKSHLRELTATGTPIVPTHWLPCRAEVRITEVLDEHDWLEAVLKPTVGLGAQGLHRVHRDDPKAQAIAESMLDLGGVMVQPFLSSIEDHGETSLVFIDG
jgi:glutathione synthase/RimK-type ligase-like ATP-grasp enzyme